MTNDRQTAIESRLLTVLNELKKQENVAKDYDPNTLPFHEEMNQIREYIDVGESGLAYESLVATIEAHPFVLSGQAAIRLLELGLIFGFKTDRDEDREFDRR